MLSKTTRKWQGDFIEWLMLVYTSAKLSNFFLWADCHQGFVLLQNPTNAYKLYHYGNPLIQYFYINHNAPCLPPKFCINILFNIQYFSWDDCNIQEKLKTKSKIIGVLKQGA